VPNKEVADAGGVASGRVRPAEPGPEVKRLEVFIGRWITEGYIVDEDGNPGAKIVASDVYQWAPGNFFVIHPAYGRVGDVGVGGVEIIRFEHATGRYLAQFLDSQGNANTSDLTSDGENWTWQGETTRCTGEFSVDGRTLTAHHERRTENGSWVPSMEVVLTKVE
jgi:Protein of unknown function (DUF1579)